MSYNDFIYEQMTEEGLDPFDEPEPFDDLEPVDKCSMCGEGLYEGDFAFNIQGDIICQKCMEDHFGFFVFE